MERLDLRERGKRIPCPDPESVSTGKENHEIPELAPEPKTEEGKEKVL